MAGCWAPPPHPVLSHAAAAADHGVVGNNFECDGKGNSSCKSAATFEIIGTSGFEDESVNSAGHNSNSSSSNIYSTLFAIHDGRKNNQSIKTSQTI